MANPRKRRLKKRPPCAPLKEPTMTLNLDSKVKPKPHLQSVNLIKSKNSKAQSPRKTYKLRTTFKLKEQIAAIENKLRE